VRREGKHSDKLLPHLIFLDLNLPKKPGLVVLKELKEDATLKLIPVIVVSGSEDPKAIREAYALHANCFIYKPADLDRFLRCIRTCYEFWGATVTPPPM
jgi:DNA-binding NarL/FixJ family response regulator